MVTVREIFAQAAAARTGARQAAKVPQAPQGAPVARVAPPGVPTQSMENKTLHFRVPSGIGDISWIYSKLVGLGRPLSIEVCRSRIPRAASLLSLLPGVASFSYGGFPYEAIKDEAVFIQDLSTRHLVWEAERRPVGIALNSWLEGGHRIEEFLPDLPTVHHYEINLPELDVQQADELLSPWKRFVVFYAASKRAAEAFNGWGLDEWDAFAGLFFFVLGRRIDGVVLLGATWDGDLAGQIFCRWSGCMKNLVGRLSLAGSLHVLRRAAYTVAFASGLPILAVVMGCPVAMFYPARLEKLINAWAPTEMILSRQYAGRVFCPPTEAFFWLPYGEVLHKRLCCECPSP